MNQQTEKILNKIEKLTAAEQLAVAKMILMGVADFGYPDSPAGETLWAAKDLVIDFEQAVGI